MRAIVAVLVIFVSWQVVAMTTGLPSYVLPSPLDVANAIKSQPFYLLVNLWASTWKAALATMIVLLLSLSLAVASETSPGLRTMLISLSGSFEAVPKVVLAPIFIVWFGIGATPKIALAVLICFFPAFQRIDAGWRAIPKEVGDFATGLSADHTSILREIYLPWIVPDILEAVRLSIPLAFVGVIIGEIIASASGIGVVVMMSMGRLDMPMVFAAAAMVAATAGLGVFFLSRLLDISLRRYRDA